MTHSIVTYNTPRPRDLHGRLYMRVQTGDASVIKITKGISEPDGYMDVVEAGHSGCGVHDWHTGDVPFEFTADHVGSVKLVFGIDPDPEDPERDGKAENSAAVTICVVDPKIAVDANRDGDIDLKEDSDKTTQEKPYRFWLNDDDDTERLSYPDAPPAESEMVPATRPDYSAHQIVSKRNLEDFTRLWVRPGAIQSALVTGAVQVGLKWKTVDSGSPAINIYPSKDAEGSLSYITDDGAAAKQIEGIYGTAVTDSKDQSTVDGTFIFKPDYWKGLDGDHPKKCLLFEGAGEGKGELQLVFYDQNGTQLGDGGSVWLDLKNIKRMYVRGKAQPENIDAPNGNVVGPFTGPMSYVDDPGDYSFDPNPNEIKQAILLVHGWSIDYNTYQNFSETMYKRLWHKGFKGRFCALRWDPLIVATIGDIPVSAGEYNRSESRAWLYGESLRLFGNAIKNQGFALSLIGHSMGNIVTGSALQKGLTVKNLLLMEAAIPAGCFDTSGDINGYGRFEAYEANKPTPDYHYISNGYRGFLSSVYSNVTGTIINFHNSVDYALATGYKAEKETNWETNQIDYKPDGNAFTDWHYEYDPGETVVSHRAKQLFTFFPGRWVTDTYEIKSFVSRPRSKAAGAVEGSNGNPNINGMEEVNLRTKYGFGRAQDDHSGQFNRKIQDIGGLYKDIVNIVAGPSVP